MQLLLFAALIYGGRLDETGYAALSIPFIIMFRISYFLGDKRCGKALNGFLACVAINCCFAMGYKYLVIIENEITGQKPLFPIDITAPILLVITVFLCYFRLIYLLAKGHAGKVDVLAPLYPVLIAVLTWAIPTNCAPNELMWHKTDCDAGKTGLLNVMTLLPLGLAIVLWYEWAGKSIYRLAYRRRSAPAVTDAKKTV